MEPAQSTISHAPSADGVWHHCHLLPEPGQDTALRDGAIVVADGRIVWLGAHAALPDSYRHLPRHDAGGAWITPGLVDCHTHLVYGGQRADEFAMRLAGASYEEIARAGGGIVSTVRATREADEDTLFAQAAGRLRPLLAEGVTAIEIKSGYGPRWTPSASSCAWRAGSARPSASPSTPPSWARTRCHPSTWAGRTTISIWSATPCCRRWPGKGWSMPWMRSARASASRPRRPGACSRPPRAHGLPVKLHAEQLSNLGGAALAASHHALSADHLEHLDEAGVRAMAAAGTVAVLLPGAYYFLRDTHLPPLALLREHGVRIALATDHNPGTSPTTSLLLMMNMACTLFRMTVPEVLAGVTTHAAHALGAADRHGTLAAGRAADFVLWQVATPAELAYWFGRNPCAAVVRQGRIYPTETSAGATP